MNGELPDSDEKRREARHRVTLRSSVLVTAMKIDESGDDYLVLQGELLDVSAGGLALIISHDDMLELNAMGGGIKLQLMLPLPAQAIELEAIPVRFQKLSEAEYQSRMLLGAQISNMSGRDRILFMNFIHGL